MSGMIAVSDFVASFRPKPVGIGATTAATAGGANDEIKLLVPGDLGTYLILATMFLPALVVGPLVFRWVHKRTWGDWPFRTAVSRWQEFWRAAFALLLVVGTGFLIARMLFPARFTAVPRGIDHLPWFLLGLAVILVQSFAEEVAFKGYLYRVWGAVIPYRWPLVVLVSAAFTSLHWDNADFARDRAMAVIQFMVGSFISFWLYLRTQSLAAPTGLHWANNVFAIQILAGTPGDYGVSALATYADPVLLAGRSNLTDPEAWVALVLGNLAFVALIAHPASPLHIAARRPPEARTTEPAAPPPIPAPAPASPPAAGEPSV